MNYFKIITIFLSFVSLSLLSGQAFASVGTYEIVQKSNGQYHIKTVVSSEQLAARAAYKDKYHKATSELEKQKMKKEIKTNLELRKKLGLRPTPLTDLEKQARKDFNERYDKADEATRSKLREQIKNDGAFRRKLGLLD